MASGAVPTVMTKFTREAHPALGGHHGPGTRLTSNASQQDEVANSKRENSQLHAVGGGAVASLLTSGTRRPGPSPDIPRRRRYLEEL